MFGRRLRARCSGRGYAHAYARSDTVTSREIFVAEEGSPVRGRWPRMRSSRCCRTCRMHSRGDEREVTDRAPGTSAGRVAGTSRNTVTADHRRRPHRARTSTRHGATTGSTLTESESVHHKDGQRARNTPDNLELWVKPQPAGQRVKYPVTFVLENYPDFVSRLRSTESGTSISGRVGSRVAEGSRTRLHTRCRSSSGTHRTS